MNKQNEVVEAANFFPATHPHITSIGRTQETDEGLMFSYPNVTFRISFYGNFIKMHLQQFTGFDGDNHFLVKINQQEAYKLAVVSTQNEYILAENLPTDFHEIELIKITESNCGYCILKGFSLNSNATLEATKAKKLKLEFIGDSITCGYGIETSDAEAPFLPETENSTMAYASVTANILNADLQTNAFSGIEMYRNYGNGSIPMPKLYPLTMPYDGGYDFHPHNITYWGFDSFTPDVLIIALGTNDLWDDNFSPKEYIEAYLEFIDFLREKYGESLPIICTLSPLLIDHRREMLKGSIDYVINEKQKTDKQLYYFEFSPCGELGYGASWHPSAAQQRLNGEELATFLNQLINTSF